MNRTFLIDAKMSLISYAVLVLAACGGGMRTFTATSPASGRIHIGGMVSGLVGSGLVLSNGSDNLPISMNGSFTFATNTATGATYNVTSYTQPVNPSQTCVVTYGSGTMNSSNFTNASVVCMTVLRTPTSTALSKWSSIPSAPTMEMSAIC